jgi:2-aminoethylphosphonate-pyruvate transaminase
MMTAKTFTPVGSLVPNDGKALVVANGVYGERIAEMLRIHKKPFEIVTSDVLQPMNLEEVDQRLACDRSFSHVVAVHHETTTGRLNDLAALGALCKAHRVNLLLDAVSSFGGELLELDSWNVEACAATANKCLHGVPGVCFVLARRATLEASTSASPCLYLDLFRNYQEQEAGFPMFTPAVQSMYALHEALCELEDHGGWMHRRRHYRRLSMVVRRGLEAQSQRLLLEDEQQYSSMLSSFMMPEGIVFEDLFCELKHCGFVIYSGQRALNGKIFRIAVMGELAEEDMLRFNASFAKIISNTRNYPESASIV